MILGLITADLRYNRLETTRSLLATLGTPVYWVADLPLRLRDWSDKYLQSPLALAEENERLHRANLILQGRSQQMASLQAENVRLRALLNSSALLRVPSGAISRISFSLSRKAPTLAPTTPPAARRLIGMAPNQRRIGPIAPLNAVSLIIVPARSR